MPARRPCAGRLRRPAAALLLALAAATCSDSTAPEEPGYSVRIHETVDDTLRSIGATRDYVALVWFGDQVQTDHPEWVSRKPDVVSVDEAGIATAIANGEAWLVATGPEGSADSVLVVVRQRPAHIEFLNFRPASYVGQQVDFDARLVDALGTPVGLSVTWGVRSARGSTIDTAGRYTPVSAGIDTVVASFEGLPDEARQISAVDLPRVTLRLASAPSGIGRAFVGAGQYLGGADDARLVSDAYIVAPLDLVVESSDPAVATVTPNPTRIREHNIEDAVRVVGLTPGKARLVVNAFGRRGDTTEVVVTTPRLQHATMSGGPLVLGDTARIWAYVTDSAGTPHPRIESLVVRVRSTNESIIRPLADSAIALADRLATGFVSVVPTGVGSASIILEAPGHLPDTIRYVTVAPKLAATRNDGAP